MRIWYIVKPAMVCAVGCRPAQNILHRMRMQVLVPSPSLAVTAVIPVIALSLGLFFSLLCA